MQVSDIRVLQKTECVGPVDYLRMHSLLAGAAHVITDSGGLQNEAHYYKVPCITFRTETEWVETLIGGWNTLFNVETGTSESLNKQLNRDIDTHQNLSYAVDGSPEIICSTIKDWIKQRMAS